VEVLVPDLGDFDDVEVIEIIVQPGDDVDAESPLLTLETDKAAMDVPSPAAGRVSDVRVAVGDRVSAGDLIVVLDSAADSGVAGTASESAEEQVTDDAQSEVLATLHDAPIVEGVPEAIRVPDLGDFSDVEVVEVLVASGDTVSAEQGLVTLETDKAMMEVPTLRAGTIIAVKLAVGDRVSTGDEVAVIRPAIDVEGMGAAEPATDAAIPVQASTDTAQAVAERPAAEVRSAARPLASPAPPPIDESSFGRAHASPAVRKLGRELGVDLGRVRGSGRKNRVTSVDVKAFVKQAMLEQAGAQSSAQLPKVPTIDFAKFGEVEVTPLSRIQKISGPRLHASWLNVPHVTQNDLADITDLETRRQALKTAALDRDIRLTPLAFVMRACVLALNEFPVFRSSLSSDGEALVLKRYTHIGFAAETPKGLVVPVIRDADRKAVYELAAELGELSAAARDGALKAPQLQGGVFTISSLGGIGGTYFTPIINAPEVAILGVSRSQMQPVYVNGEFVPRLMLPLSLSYDHRVIDGAQAVRFTTRLCELLGDVERLLEIDT